MMVMLEAFKVKKIPRLFWSSEKTFTLIPKPLPLFMLLIGLFLFGFGEALLVVSGMGMSPLDSSGRWSRCSNRLDHWWCDVCC